MKGGSGLLHKTIYFAHVYIRQYNTQLQALLSPTWRVDILITKIKISLKAIINFEHLRLIKITVDKTSYKQADFLI